MIHTLFSLIVFCLVGGLLYWLVLQLPLPAPFDVILRVCVILIFILIILSLSTGWDVIPKMKW